MRNRIAAAPGYVRRYGTLAPVLLLIAINSYIALNLFTVEFTQRMESIESSYMSISRWAVDHWDEKSGWFPLWFTGMPFHRVYQPGLHLTVAAVARTLGWTPQHAYHFLTGLAYALGPLTLFWLCYRATGRRGYALITGLLYSLVSPVCFVVPLIRHDVGGLLLPRRFQTLVHYGEGPHTTALLMLPLVIWLIDRAASGKDWRAIAAAPLALAALVLTNWPGAMGLSMAILAYCIAHLGAREGKQRLHWPILIGTGALAYLVACSWLPPSIIRAVLRNAHQSDATKISSAQLIPLGVIALAVIALHLLFRRFKAGTWIRFCAYFAVITGVVSIGREWFGWRLLPQPNRFQLEWEMAIIAAGAFAAAWVWSRLPRPAQAVALAAFVVFCGMQVVRYRKYARWMTQPIDITSTVEYRMARWFDANMDGARVFAPGNVSLWMNMFTDVPQMAGCCDQGIPTQQYRIAVYTIYTGQNAGARDAEISTLWLKAFGADAVGVTGPGSTEYFKPYWNPRKFDGVLPLLWREGDNAVYRVPRRSTSLAHVVGRTAVVSRPAENGLDVAAIEPLVAALDDPKLPFAAFRWVNLSEAEIQARIGRDQLIFVQVTYDPGWRAIAGGRRLRIAPDALGMMIIEPGQTGPVTIHLVWDGGPEALMMRAATIFGFLLLVLWTVFWRHTLRPSRSTPV